MGSPQYGTMTPLPLTSTARSIRTPNQIDLALECPPPDYPELVAKWKASGHRCELTLLHPHQRSNGNSYAVRLPRKCGRGKNRQISLSTTCHATASARRFELMRGILAGQDIDPLTKSWRHNLVSEANLVRQFPDLFVAEPSDERKQVA